MDWEKDETPSRLRLCQIGLGLTALALGLLCLSDLADILVDFFGGWAVLDRIRAQPLWFWGVHTLIPWASLIGAYLFWGRWHDSSWQWRAGLLVLMNGFDVATWFVFNADELGIALGRFEHRWLVQILSGTFGWFELMLTAWLASTITKRSLGEPEDTPAGAAASASLLGIFGLLLWLVIVTAATRWHWPFRPRRLGRDLVGLYRILTFVQALLTYQVTVLCLYVSRQCGRYRRDWERDQNQGDLLRSRSETEVDDTFWK